MGTRRIRRDRERDTETGPDPDAAAAAADVSGSAAGSDGADDAPAWTAEQIATTLQMVSDLQQVLRLSDWDVAVDFDSPASEDTFAEVLPFPYQKRAELQFGPVFGSLDADDVRHTLLHELIHCHLFPLHQLVEDLLRAAAGADKAELALVAVDAAIEQVTDAFADVLAPLTSGLSASHRPAADRFTPLAGPPRLPVVPCAVPPAQVNAPVIVDGALDPSVITAAIELVPGFSPAHRSADPGY